MAFDIAFDYRFDRANFYGAAARAALEEAARIWEGIVGDEFDDVPAGISFSIDDPSRSGTDRTIVLDTAIDDLVIFMGTQTLSAGLAQGGFDGTDAAGDAFKSRISNDWRGTGPVTDFEPWAGTITFDPGVDWSFGLAGPTTGRFDFVTTALHEIGHVLGVGTAAIFDAIGAGGSSTGRTRGPRPAAPASRWSPT